MLPSKVQNINAQIEQVYELNNSEVHAPFRKSTYYINHTSEDVVVVHRNNLPVSIRKAEAGVIVTKFFIVRTVYKFQNSQEIVETINMITEYQKLNGDNNIELNAIKDMLTEAFNNNRSLRNCEIIIDAKILTSTLNKLKVVYCNTTDLLLMSKDYHANINHPYSAEGRTFQQFKDMDIDVKHSGVIVEIVDNESSYGKRFMKIGKDYIEIEPRTDSSRSSGVYVTEMHSKDGLFSTKSISLNINDAQEKYGIYPTREQAVSEDQVEQLSKQKLLVAQNDLERTRTENAKILEQSRYETESIKSLFQRKEAQFAHEKIDLEKSLAESRRMLAETEAVVKQAKIEHEKVKDELNIKALESENKYKEKSRIRDDYYDSRSAERKDNSEYVKIGAAGLITGLGVWAAMRKYG